MVEKTWLTESGDILAEHQALQRIRLMVFIFLVSKGGNWEQRDTLVRRVRVVPRKGLLGVVVSRC